jgi:acetyl esterase
MNDATPWIDPELVAAGKLLQEKGLVAPDRTVAPLSEVRLAQDRVGAFLGLDSVPLQSERDVMLPGPHGDVPSRFYYPEGIDRPACLVYLHGGGFMQGSLDSWDHFLRDLVRQSGVAVLSVDYRLSPEHKFPVAFDETVAIVRLMASDGATQGIDPRRLAIGGDSAGANLALAAALALRDAREQLLSFQLLIYGVYSADVESPSWQRFGRGAGLSQTQFRWILETYLENPAQQADWRVAPLLADLTGLPPAHLIVGSLDPLLDDSNNLAAKLKAAEVPSDLTIYQGINHGFIRYGRLIRTARNAVADCAAALKIGMAATT